MIKTWYHATPFEFTTLNKESWISSNRDEAIGYLFLKNISENRAPREGSVISFNLCDDYVANLVQTSYTTLIGQTTIDVHIGPTGRMTFEEYLESIPVENRCLFYPTEVVAMTPFVKGLI